MYSFSKSLLTSAHMYVACFILDKRFKKRSYLVRKVVKVAMISQLMVKVIRNCNMLFLAEN